MKYYSVSSGIIVLSEGRAVFEQYIKKSFIIKIFTSCDCFGYTYDMKVYFGKDQQCATQDVATTHATLMDLIRKDGRTRP
jgi:hypothetical protein